VIVLAVPVTALIESQSRKKAQREAAMADDSYPAEGEEMDAEPAMEVVEEETFEATASEEAPQFDPASKFPQQ